MSKQEPDTETMTVFETSKRLSRLVPRVSQNEIRILVEEAGVPMAALVSVDDLRRLNELDRAWDERTEAINRFSQAFNDVPAEEAEVEVARAIDESRQRRATRTERQTA